MQVIKANKLMSKLEKCPKCGSDIIGNGKGGLIIEEDYAERWCCCGYRIKLNEDGEEIE